MGARGQGEGTSPSIPYVSKQNCFLFTGAQPTVLRGVGPVVPGTDPETDGGTDSGLTPGFLPTFWAWGPALRPPKKAAFEKSNSIVVPGVSLYQRPVLGKVVPWKESLEGRILADSLDTPDLHDSPGSDSVLK